jgi:ferredoxin-NADP reductase
MRFGILNDRASLGMTVEAHGPFGHFCFDESQHRNVVLLAAGSGITPMMAMLRYMDDLCLETTATLLYCVRTSSDIIFELELEQLRSRLKNFQYHVLLSQPHAEWSGPRGTSAVNSLKILSRTYIAGLLSLWPASIYGSDPQHPA